MVELYPRICFTDHFYYPFFGLLFSAGNGISKMSDICCLVMQHPQNTHYMFVKIFTLLFIWYWFYMVFNSYKRNCFKYLMRKSRAIGVWNRLFLKMFLKLLHRLPLILPAKITKTVLPKPFSNLSLKFLERTYIFYF